MLNGTIFDNMSFLISLYQLSMILFIAVKKPVFYIFISFFLLSPAYFYKIFAQNQLSDWKEIERHQRFVMTQIEKKEYYLNEYKINANRFNLHQPAYFQYFERFFYTFDRRENPPKTLLKAMISRKERNKINFYKEYVLDNDGNLVYYYEQEQPETSSLATKKLKIYLFNEKVIKAFKNDKEILDKEPQKIHNQDMEAIIYAFQQLKAKFK